MSLYALTEWARLALLPASERDPLAWVRDVVAAAVGTVTADQAGDPLAYSAFLADEVAKARITAHSNPSPTRRDEILAWSLYSSGDAAPLIALAQSGDAARIWADLAGCARMEVYTVFNVMSVPWRKPPAGLQDDALTRQHVEVLTKALSDQEIKHSSEFFAALAYFKRLDHAWEESRGKTSPPLADADQFPQPDAPQSVPPGGGGVFGPLIIVSEYLAANGQQPPPLPDPPAKSAPTARRLCALEAWADQIGRARDERDPLGWVRERMPSEAWGHPDTPRRIIAQDEKILLRIAHYFDPTPIGWKPHLTQFTAWTAYVQRYGLANLIELAAPTRKADAWAVLVEEAKAEAEACMIDFGSISALRDILAWNSGHLAALSFLVDDDIETARDVDVPPDKAPIRNLGGAFLFHPDYFRWQRRQIAKDNPAAQIRAAVKWLPTLGVKDPPPGANWDGPLGGRCASVLIDGTPFIVQGRNRYPAGDASYIVAARHYWQEMKASAAPSEPPPPPVPLGAWHLPPAFGPDPAYQPHQGEDVMAEWGGYRRLREAKEQALMMAGMQKPSPAATMPPPAAWSSERYESVAPPTERTAGQDAPPRAVKMAPAPATWEPLWSGGALGQDPSAIPYPPSADPCLMGAPDDVQTAEIAIYEPSVVEIREDGIHVRALAAPADPYAGPVRLRVTVLVPSAVVVGHGISVRPLPRRL